MLYTTKGTFTALSPTIATKSRYHELATAEMPGV